MASRCWAPSGVWLNSCNLASKSCSWECSYVPLAPMHVRECVAQSNKKRQHKSCLHWLITSCAEAHMCDLGYNACVSISVYQDKYVQLLALLAQWNMRPSMDFKRCDTVYVCVCVCVRAQTRWAARANQDCLWCCRASLGELGQLEEGMTSSCPPPATATLTTSNP